jgi:hypothetical protein
MTGGHNAPAHDQGAGKQDKQRHSQDSTFTRNALAVVSTAGYAVFPVAANGKAPAIPAWENGHGCRDATTDTDTIRAWGKQYPRANVGIATGNGLYVIDEDTDKGGDAGALLLPPTFTVKTPHGRHFYYLVGEDLPNTTGHLGAHIDTRGAGGYVLAAGSVVDGLRYVEMTPGAPVANLPERIAALVRAPEKVARASAPSSGGSVPSNGQKWLDEALGRASVGVRNETGFWLACQLRDDGLRYEQAEPLVIAYADGVPGAGYTQDDALRSLAQAYSRPARDAARSRSSSPAPPSAPTVPTSENGAPDEDRPFHFPFLTLSQLRARPKPEPLIDNVLAVGGLSVIHGDSSVGKTMVVIDMGQHITRGAPWRGHAVKQGDVWLIAAEGSKYVELNLSAAAAIARDCEDAEALEQHFLTYDAPINLCESGDVARLLDDIGRHAVMPVWVIFDTLSQTSIGYSDSDNGEMARYIDSMRRIAQATGAHVTTVHHHGWNDKLRGASTIKSNVDTEIEISGNGAAGQGVISCHKQRGGWEKFAPLGFRIRKIPLDDYGSFSGAVAEDTGANQQKCLDVLIGAGSGGLDAKTWLLQASLGESSFYSAKKTLENRGLCASDGQKIWRASTKAIIRYPRNSQGAPSPPSDSKSAPIGAGEHPTTATPLQLHLSLRDGVDGVALESLKKWGQPTRASVCKQCGQSGTFRADDRGNFVCMTCSHIWYPLDEQGRGQQHD